MGRFTFLLARNFKCDVPVFTHGDSLFWLQIVLTIRKELYIFGGAWCVETELFADNIRCLLGHSAQSSGFSTCDRNQAVYVIGFFVIVTCAATLNKEGVVNITDAAQAARALEPLAGTMAKALFAIGLVGAALLAASILPLSTAYSVGDLTGQPAALDDGPREAPLFYSTFGIMTFLAAGLILLPGIPLIRVLVLTQILNAILLLPLLFFMYGIAKDKRLMGEFTSTMRMRFVYGFIISLVTVCVAALLWFTVHP